jgi:hypothetical protein
LSDGSVKFYKVVETTMTDGEIGEIVKKIVENLKNNKSAEDNNTSTPNSIKESTLVPSDINEIIRKEFAYDRMIPALTPSTVITVWRDLDSVIRILKRYETDEVLNKHIDSLLSKMLLDGGDTRTISERSTDLADKGSLDHITAITKRIGDEVVPETDERAIPIAAGIFVCAAFGAGVTLGKAIGRRVSK